MADFGSIPAPHVSGAVVVTDAATTLPGSADVLLLFNGASFDRARSAKNTLGAVDVRSGGNSSQLNITGDTLVKSAPGRAIRVTVQTAIATAAVTLNDAVTVGGAAAGNAFFTIPVGTTAGSVFYLDWPCANGIVAKFGTATGAIAIAFD